MVVSPLMRGMLGLQTDAGAGTLTLTPHVPADWTSFAVRSVPIGSAKVDLQYAKDPEGITLEVKALGKVADNSPRAVEFAPAVSLRAKVLGAALNGRPVPFHVQANSVDQHVLVRIPVSGGANTLRIRLKDDFGVAYTSTLPAIGATSEGLRVVSETWTPARDRLTLAVSGRSGSQYRLSVWNAGQIASVAGAKLFKEPDGGAQLVVEFPKDLAEPVSHATISLQFVK